MAAAASAPPSQNQPFRMDATDEARLADDFSRITNANNNKRNTRLSPAHISLDSEKEAAINRYIDEHKTFRSDIPLYRHVEYWQLRADYYPYIRQTESMNDFFLRGITCHPRLSDYPTCKDVIRDYFVCRDTVKVFAIANVCAPLKEQLSACINMVFVRNHARGDKKFNEQREAKMEGTRERRLQKLLDNATASARSRNSLQD